MSEPNVRVKIWVDDDSFEAAFTIPVTASPEQIEGFTKSWFGVLQQALNLWPVAEDRE
jgi:hypothetical protein